MPQPQQGGTEEPKTNISVSQQEKQGDAACGEVIADYDPVMYYEPEGTDPNIKAVHKEEENSDVKKCKNGVTSRWDIVPEDNELQGYRKNQARTPGMRT